MGGTGAKYLYCLIRSREPREFATKGMGERGDPVRTVHFEDLAAVVSDSPQSRYEPSRRNMMAHTLVLEEVMRELTILPVQFGTVAPGEDEIRESLLKRRFGEFHGLLHEMEGRVELGLKAFWYEEVIFQEIAAERADVRRLRDSLAGRPPEATYYDRIRLGELVERALWEKRDREAQSVLAPLRGLAQRVRVNPVLTDRMVLNAAFLVDDHQVTSFDQAVRKLDAEMADRMLLKYVGPAPPYNFVNIVVSWDDPPPEPAAMAVHRGGREMGSGR